MNTSGAVVTFDMLNHALRQLQLAAERVGVVPPGEAKWQIESTTKPAMHRMFWRGNTINEPVPFFPHGILGPNKRSAYHRITTAIYTLNAIPIDGKDAHGNLVGPQPEPDALVLRVELVAMRPTGWSPGMLLEEVMRAVNGIAPDRLQFRGKVI